MHRVVTIAFCLLASVVPTVGAIDIAPVDPPLEATFEVDSFPEKLPRGERAPIALTVAATVETVDGSNPPALRQLVLELDRDSQIDGSHVPRCKVPFRDGRRSLAAMKAACKDAIVGGGKVELGIEFAGEQVIPGTSELVVFNGQAGRQRLYAVAQIAAPIKTTVVMPIEFRRRAKGRIGTKAIVSVPEIAEGFGFIADLKMTLHRRLDDLGAGVISLKCPDGLFSLETRARFENGSQVVSELSSRCRARREPAKQPVR